MTDGDVKSDTGGIERAIAGVFAESRHPSKRSEKGRRKHTPGRLYLPRGGDPHTLARRLCTPSNKYSNWIRHLPELTGTRERYRQVRVVEAVIRDLMEQRCLAYGDGCWYASEVFMVRQKRISDELRAMHRRHIESAKRREGTRVPSRRVRRAPALQSA